jgi:hypothetical protein
MRNLKLDLLGLNLMRPWDEAVHEYVVTELEPSLSCANVVSLANGF